MHPSGYVELAIALITQTPNGLLSIGGYFNLFGGSVGPVNFNVLFFGPELMYRKIAQTGLYVSARLGLGIISHRWTGVSVAVGSTSISMDPSSASVAGIGFGPAVGHEHTINNAVTLIAEGNWTHIAAGSSGLSTLEFYAGAAYTW